MDNSRYSEYDPFAWLYNKHWGDRFAPTALAVIDELVLPRLAPGAEVLDLCCGTGQMAQLLSERGYRVTGIDGSENMLFYARENAPEAHFILSDARIFTADTAFDAAVCVFDSLNHVMSIGELEEVFRSVYGALKDNGTFLFDLNTEAGYSANWHGVFGIVEDDHVCVIKNSYDTADKIALFDATLFRLEREWYRTDFKLTQKCYAGDEIRQRLERTGFTAIQTYEFTREKGLGPMSDKSVKAFFLCRKSELNIQGTKYAGQ
jgi:SAM-dependent methyltransferase